jgi:hypothetical protein
VQIEEEFEQRYDATGVEPVRIWIFCRLCRCRMQVRCVPRPALPFRCFCGHAGAFASFDVFTDEDEVRRFTSTYEQIYQTTKDLLRDAEMPMPQTRIYRADEIRRLKRGEPSEVFDSSEEAPGIADDERAFETEAARIWEKAQRAGTAMEKHDALSELARVAYARRDRSPRARSLAYQACEADVKIGRDLLREAMARHKNGERVALKFPTWKRLVALLVEDKQHERALEVASRAVQLGLPGYEEKVDKLRAHLGKR